MISSDSPFYRKKRYHIKTKQFLIQISIMPTRKCKFSQDLAKEFPMFIPSKIEGQIECLTCKNKIINICNKGRHDILQHLDSAKHKNNVGSATNCPKLTKIYNVNSTKETEKISAVEAALSYHTVYHHFSYKSTDCTNTLHHKLFEDSKIAPQIKCGKTKTQAIVDNVIAPYVLEKAREDLNKSKFIGICTDSSNHGYLKMFPVVVQYFDKFDGLNSKLVELKSCQNEKSITISKLLEETMENFDLIEKCIAFGADNTNTNFGSVLRKEGQNIFTHLKTFLGRDINGIGCPAHICNNSIHFAMDHLEVDIDSIMFKIYKYFSIYTVRVESLREICDNVEVDFKILLSHSKTRWLSLFPVIERVLKMYHPLKSYFLSIESPPVALKTFFEDPLNEALLFFVHSLAAVFHCNTAKMEADKGSILETMKILDSITEVCMRYHFC